MLPWWYIFWRLNYEPLLRFFWYVYSSQPPRFVNFWLYITRRTCASQMRPHFHVELEWKEESFQHRCSHYCIAQSINSLMLCILLDIELYALKEHACAQGRDCFFIFEPFFASQKLAQTLKSSASFKKVFLDENITDSISFYVSSSPHGWTLFWKCKSSN